MKLYIPVDNLMHRGRILTKGQVIEERDHNHAGCLMQGGAKIYDPDIHGDGTLPAPEPPAPEPADTDNEPEPTPYDDWKKADLHAEIELRNEGREQADMIEPDSDKNEDLARALEADDHA